MNISERPLLSVLAASHCRHHGIIYTKMLRTHLQQKYLDMPRGGICFYYQGILVLIAVPMLSLCIHCQVDHFSQAQAKRQLIHTIRNMPAIQENPETFERLPPSIAAFPTPSFPHSKIHPGSRAPMLFFHASLALVVLRLHAHMTLALSQSTSYSIFVSFLFVPGKVGRLCLQRESEIVLTGYASTRDNHT